MAVYVDLHVQGLNDRIVALRKERDAAVTKVEEWTSRVEAIDTNLARVSARFAVALGRTSTSAVSEAKALKTARKRARNAKAKRSGQYMLAQFNSGGWVLMNIHIARTTSQNDMGVVPVITLCGLAINMGRDVALREARDTHGDLAITLGALRAIRTTTMPGGRREACAVCITTARTMLRPAQEEAPDA